MIILSVGISKAQLNQILWKCFLFTRRLPVLKIATYFPAQCPVAIYA